MGKKESQASIQENKDAVADGNLWARIDLTALIRGVNLKNRVYRE
jgi:hypothetical protein